MPLAEERSPGQPSSPPGQAIELRGVRVHNLKNVDVSIPLQKLTVITGRSGSGKTSLAFDTLFTEGQRRYIESFPTETRRHLARLEKPDAERIDHVPPAIAFRQDAGQHSGPRATVATITEVHDGLRSLFARLGRIVCPECQIPVHRATSGSIVAAIEQLTAGVRFQLAFPVPAEMTEPGVWQRAGYARFIANDQTRMLTEAATAPIPLPAWIVVDRLIAGKTDAGRLRESVEAALAAGAGGVALFVDSPSLTALDDHRGVTVRLDDRPTVRFDFSRDLRCSSCQRTFLEPEPRLFSFYSPLGACPNCHGTGHASTLDPQILLSDRTRTLREAFDGHPLTPAGRRLVDEWLKSLGRLHLPLAEPLSTWSDAQRKLLVEGAARRKFSGLRGWFAELADQRHRPGVRGLLAAVRRGGVCPVCHGARLRPEALAVLLPMNGDAPLALAPNIATLCGRTVAEVQSDLARFVASLLPHDRALAEPLARTLAHRLELLQTLGLGELQLDRSLRAMSSGEARRVALAATLSSALVHALYVLDEPSAGLHPRDVNGLVVAVDELRRKRNTVVLVEHQPRFLERCDHVVEVGPGGGSEGGRILYSGPRSGWLGGEISASASVAGDVRSDAPLSAADKRTPWVRVRNADRHNLKNVTVEFPLGQLCVVNGVSGSGKSSLVLGTLAPLMARALGRPVPPEMNTGGATLEWLGAEGEPRPVDDVVRIDSSPLPGSQRSIPATCLKLFPLIRDLFAKTADAQARNFGPSHFSFNARDSGRCPRCEGTGQLQIDMQFLADVVLACPDCRGTRFQRDVLEIRYRGLNLTDILNMTARDAWPFFARHPKVLRKLQPLREVGLDYLPLGQAVSTLSGGERQRLKLAMHLAARLRRRTLFLMDEPAVGLHRDDVAALIRCLQNLRAVGHSLIVVDHDEALLRAADWTIELGPGAGRHGGQIVRAGPPANA